MEYFAEGMKLAAIFIFLVLIEVVVVLLRKGSNL